VKLGLSRCVTDDDDCLTWTGEAVTQMLVLKTEVRVRTFRVDDDMSRDQLRHSLLGMRRSAVTRLVLMTSQRLAESVLEQVINVPVNIVNQSVSAVVIGVYTNCLFVPNKEADLTKTSSFETVAVKYAAKYHAFSRRKWRTHITLLVAISTPRIYCRTIIRIATALTPSVRLLHSCESESTMNKSVACTCLVQLGSSSTRFTL